MVFGFVDMKVIGDRNNFDGVLAGKYLRDRIGVSKYR